MKKVIIFLLILPWLVLKAQNTEPSQVQIKINQSKTTNIWQDTYINTSSDMFKQNKFLLGWHWSEGKKMTESLQMNQAHFSDAPIANLANGVDCIMMISCVSAGGGEPRNPAQAQSMQFEPTNLIGIDPLSNIYTNPNYDSDNVFGFEYIHSGIANRTASGKLALLTSGSYINSIVLNKPFPCDKYHYNAAALYDTTDGRKWVLMININRKDLSGAVNDDVSLISIKLPYTLQNSNTGYIKFSSKPVNSRNYEAIIPTYPPSAQTRGNRLATIVCTETNGTTEIIINNKMLPTDMSSITIEAEFECGKVSDLNSYPAYYRNPYLQNPEGGNPSTEPNYIKELGCEVKYLGNRNVEIDWIRICTPLGRSLMYGCYDARIVEMTENAIKKYSDYTALS